MSDKPSVTEAPSSSTDTDGKTSEATKELDSADTKGQTAVEEGEEESYAQTNTIKYESVVCTCIVSARSQINR